MDVLLKFKKDVYDRYYHQHKLDLDYRSMFLMNSYLDSKDFIDTGRNVSTVPFVDRGVYIIGQHIEKGDYPAKEGNTDLSTNSAYALNFRQQAEFVYLFDFLQISKRNKRLRDRPSISFTVTNVNPKLQDFISQGKSIEDIEDSDDSLYFEPEITITFNDIVMRAQGKDKEDRLFLGQEEKLKSLAKDLFSIWCKINYFLHTFEKELIVYDAKPKQDNKKKKKRKKGKKSPVKLSKVYKLRLNDDMVQRHHREINYEQASGERSGYWAMKRVKADFWDRVEEDNPKYRVPSQEEIDKFLQYSEPIEEGKIFIQVKVDRYEWSRNEALLKGNVGYLPTSYRL
jgi:hypothetical protein